MNRIEIEDLIGGDDRLASLPEVFYRLQDAVDNPTTSFESIAAIVEQDTVLTARVLRVANSGLYAFPTQIHSVGRAVSIIGTQQLRDIVLATVVINRFKGIDSEIVSMEGFWRHALGCAVVARMLASLRREPNVERYYVAGLLHDIGRLVLLLRIPAVADDILRERNESKRLTHLVERDFLGFDHAELGAALLRAWRLPAFYAEAVGCHHGPCSATAYPTEAAVVHVADIITNALRFGDSGGHFACPLDEIAYAHTGLAQSSLESLVDRADQHYRCAVACFIS